MDWTDALEEVFCAPAPVPLPPPGNLFEAMHGDIADYLHVPATMLLVGGAAGTCCTCCP